MSMTENIYMAGDFRLHYYVEKSFYNGEVGFQAVIEKGEGCQSTLVIPKFITVDEKNIPVRVIGKKAFLGNPGIVNVTLPETITSIDNWAFAQCDNLAKIVLMQEQDMHNLMEKEKMPDIFFGKGVFDDCKSLKHICIGEDKEDSLSALLGVLFNRLDGEYLMKDNDLGKKEWFAKWDNRLMDYLKQDDEDGLNNQMLGGEEDINKNTLGYIYDRKKNKASLCLTRLIYRDYLEAETEKIITAYLLNNSKEFPDNGAWKVIVEEHPDEMTYYEILNLIGGITPDNLDKILEELGESHIEAKAYLMSLNQVHYSGDTFDEFSLD